MKKPIFYLLITIIGIPILLYGISDLMSVWNRIHVKDEFYIEYSESCNSIELNNTNQSFICDVKEAYWNTDSLVVSGKNGCFIIEFGKTKYNDEMKAFECSQLFTVLKNTPIYKYIKTVN